MDVIVDRCAALDVHKDTVMACVRKAGPGGRRRVQEVREFRTWTSSRRELRDWLAGEAVTQVAMEATGVYWRPVWHVLVDLADVELLLCNAHHVKNVPGRKTDVADSVWLCQLLECGLLRAASCRHRRSPGCATSLAIARSWSRIGGGRPSGSRSCSRMLASSSTRWCRM